MILLLPAALAAPSFESNYPGDARIAARAWTAAEICTGWSGKAHATIVLERGKVWLGFRGLASSDKEGIYHISLDSSDPNPNEVIVHEIAHAWVSEGPTALVEGRAELLADCIVHHAPGIAPLQWDDGRQLHSLVALQQWSVDGKGPSYNPFQRTDAYIAAARLVRVASLVLPEGALWPENDKLDWKHFDALLVEAGEPAQPIRDLLKGTGAQQALALSDHDGDGLPAVGEQMFNTDPNAYDSDGDGWWDGAAVATDTRPLPFDGTPICTGWATPASGARVRLKTGGNLRGSPAPLPILRAGPQRTSEGELQVWGGQSILVELSGGGTDVSGGLWADVEGEGLVRDTGCAQSDRVVVWSVQPALRSEVASFAAAIEEAILKLDSRLGGGVERIAVSLGGSKTAVHGSTVHVSTSDLKSQLPAEIAAQVVAMRRVWDMSNQRDWRDVVAVQRSLLKP